MEAKALLLIWTLVSAGFGGGTNQTSTVVSSIQVCEKAAAKINAAKISTKGTDTYVTVTAICVPL